MLAGHFFLDSSAVVKYYHREPGTEQIDKLFKVTGARYGINLLTILEVHSALAKKVRQELVSKEAFEFLCVRLFYDQANSLYEVHPLDPSLFTEAERLLKLYGSMRDLWASDALHVAAALYVRADYFVSSDRVQLEVDQSEGLQILNPEGDPSTTP